MEKIESFENWLLKKNTNLDEGWRDAALAGVLAASALGSPYRSMAANTSVNDPSVTAPEDSVGMIPQIRYWDNIDKKGHMVNFDKLFVYLRFTDSPDVITKIPRDSLSDKDKEYVSKHEKAFIDSKNVVQNNRGVQPPNHSPQNSLKSDVKKFNPNFGPKPSKNASPMQVWKYQFNLIRKAEAEITRGRRPPVDYVILYKYYGGQMPDPPEEQ